MTEVTTTGTNALATYAPELSNTNGQITTTSTQVAQHFGKANKSVLRAIRNLECSTEFHQRNFAPVITEYQNGKGGTQEATEYTITRDGFVFLAMGFTGKEAAQWKEAYITAFNKMEAELSSKPLQLPQTITPEQCQHLRELVQLVVESGKQSRPWPGL